MLGVVEVQSGHGRLPGGGDIQIKTQSRVGEVTSQVNIWGKGMPGGGHRKREYLPRCVLEPSDKVRGRRQIVGGPLMKGFASHFKNHGFVFLFLFFFTPRCRAIRGHVQSNGTI